MIHLASSYANQLLGERDGSKVAARPGHIVIGYAVLGLMALTFTTWSMFVPLEEATVASGIVNVSGQRRPIAHLDGGRVDQLLVHEGEEVEDGQILLTLNGEEYQSQLNVLRYQSFATQLKVDRLRAERGQLERPAFRSSLLLAASKDDHLAELISNEVRNFTTRRDYRAGKLGLLNERIARATEQKDRLHLQLASVKRQLDIVGRQAADIRGLYQKGYATKSDAYARERELEQLKTQELQIEKELTELQGVVEEASTNQALFMTEFYNSVDAELIAAHTRDAELQEEITATQRRLGNLEIKAPVRGVVVDLQVQSANDVIAPAERILDVVPVDESYLIEARIAPEHIDGVAPGLPVEIRFPAYAGKYVPTMVGKVSMVSADVIADERRQHHFYLAHVDFDQELFDQEREDLALIPGMPAEVIIKKRDRTLFQYLFAPFTDHLATAFAN